ncbi:DUF4411 family protein [Pseudomonas sp. CBSPCAW29]|nr:DUF4411 family protein [Pseudomonas sp. CBSPCAW29]
MVPELWAWLLHQSQNGRIKMPIEIYEEILAGKEDILTGWLKMPEVKSNLVLQEGVNPGAVAHVTYNGYAADLNENELAYIGRDPFLISYALSNPADRCVYLLKPLSLQHRGRIGRFLTCVRR